MAKVKIDKGPISATDRLDSLEPIPESKWGELLRARCLYIHIQFPHDCRCLLDWVREAQAFRMWEKTGHKDLGDLIRNGLELDPEQVEWALIGLKHLKPDWAVPFEKAVKAGMLAVKSQAESAPELKDGGDRKSEVFRRNQGDNVTLKKRGNDQSYLARRLKRDHPAIFDKLETYPSVRAAALEAGIVKPTVTLPADLEGMARWICRKLTNEKLDRFIAMLEEFRE